MNGNQGEKSGITTGILTTALGGLIVIFAMTTGSFYVNVSNQLSLLQQEVGYIQKNLAEISEEVKRGRRFSKDEAQLMRDDTIEFLENMMELRYQQLVARLEGLEKACDKIQVLRENKVQK